MKNLGHIVSALFRQFIIAVIAFESVVIGGIALFMAVGMLVGYLPYSDRPGPGWYGPSETIPSLPVVWQWLHLNYWAPPMYAAAVFLLVKTISVVPKLPRMVIRIIGTLLTAFVALFWVLATGWYFSLSLSVQWVSLAFSILYGAWVLPTIIYGKRAPPNKAIEPTQKPRGSSLSR